MKIRRLWEVMPALCFGASLASTAPLAAPPPLDRYETAIVIAKDHAFAPLPALWKRSFGTGIASKSDGFFFDIVRNPLFREKFIRLSRELDKKQYFNSENISYLDDIRSTLSQKCRYERFPNPQNPDIDVSCGDRYGYYSSPNQYLATKFGNFIVAKANSFRGNGDESNRNASPAILVLDLKDNNIGLTTEDQVAVSGGRKDVLEAVATFAAAADRVAAGPAAPSAKIVNDLKTARARKSFRRYPHRQD